MPVRLPARRIDSGKEAGKLVGMDREQLRARIGPWGVDTFKTSLLSPAESALLARGLDEQGWPVLWIPEIGLTEALSEAGHLLANSERLIVANAIARIGDRTPGNAAAYGPKMVQLGGERSLGAMTYLVTPEHTAGSRELLGVDAVLVAEQAVVFTEDQAEARAIARAHTARYVGSGPHERKFAALGFGSQDWTAKSYTDRQLRKGLGGLATGLQRESESIAGS